MEIQKKIIAVEVINEHGVLARIAGLFAGRGYNIEGLTVAAIPDTNLSRVTIQTHGNKRVLEQIVKQLHKLIPVLRVIEHDDMIEEEMALVRFSIESSLADITSLAGAFNGRIVNVSADNVVAMATDTPERISQFLKACTHFNPKEVIRSGVVAIER